MKLTVLLTIAALFQIQANTYSQNKKISLDFSNASVETIIHEIESISEFKFLLNRKDVDLNRKVSIKVEKQKIENILSQLFSNTDVAFEILNKQIVLRKSISNLPPSPKLDVLVPSKESTQLQITGTIKDQDGTPLPGANILEKGTTNGTQADFDGNFSISVENENAIIVISYVGFATKEVALDGQTVMTIKMEESTAGLDEVVVVGYGTVKKSDLTGAVSSVSSRTIKNLQLNSPEEALRGNAPGVRVIQTTGAPGAEVTVRIRGNNSIQGNNSPLYVVDGLPIQGGLSNISPNSIQSMDILKDASATAIYGARAANGVVIITTKSGKSGKSQIDITLSTGIENVINTLNVLNNTQYARAANEALTNDGKATFFDLNNLGSVNTDWQDLIFNSGVRNNYSVLFSGGREKNVYSIISDVLDIKGVVKGSGFQRQGIQLNLNQDLNDWFGIQNHYNLNHSKRNNIFGGNPNQIGGNARGTTISSALAAPPTIAPFSEDGEYSILFPYTFIEPIPNPVAFTQERIDEAETFNVFGSTSLNFSFSDELNLEMKGGINYSNERKDVFESSRLNVSGVNNGSIEYNNSFYWLLQSTLNFEKEISPSSIISALVGITAEEQYNKSLLAGGSAFPNENTTNQSIQSAALPNITQTFTDKFNLISYFGRFNYNLKDKYLFTATGRVDGSSRLGPENKFGFFPSFAIGWKLGEEKFIKDSNIFNNLKLRGSWGITGNTNIRPYQSLANYQVTQSFIDGSNNLAIGYAPSNIANQNLKWEETAQLNLGLDASFFSGDLNITLDFYDKTTKDLLAVVNLPQSSGFSTVLTNIGKVKNKGFEILATANFINSENIFWSTTATFATNMNKVLQTANEDPIFGSTHSVFPPVTVSKPGSPISSFWGYIREDMLTEEGLVQFKDLNQDGEITAEDNTIIGNPNPDFIYSFSSNLEYKNLTIDFLLEGSQGNDIFNISKMELNDNFNKGGNMTTETLDRWSPENPNRNAQYPKLGTSSFPTPSNQYVEDGSYLRLKQLTLGYNVNTNNLKSSFIKSLRVYVRALNLLTITNYSWFDPEVNSFGNDGLNFGLERNSYPQIKSYALGINLTL